jgi:hypothetical protein
MSANDPVADPWLPPHTDLKVPCFAGRQFDWLSSRNEVCSQQARITRATVAWIHLGVE